MINTLSLRGSLVASTLAILILANPAQAVSITNVVDSPTEYSGDFLASGLSGESGFRPTDFADLPEPSPGLFIDRSRYRDGVSVSIRTRFSGAPDNPFFRLIIPAGDSLSGQSLSGTYTNGLGGGTVDWSFTNLSDPGGYTGDFTGSFSFVLQGAANTGGNVPEGGPSALMLGVGLFGLVGLRRKFR